MITQAFNPIIHEALIQQHHASQYVGMAGWYLLPQLPDQSNTNMGYVAESKMLVGNTLPNGLSVGLQLSSLQLHLIREGKTTNKAISLIGKTQEAVYKELREALEQNGVDTSNLLNKPNNPIPSHDLHVGGMFSIPDQEAFNENTHYRQNAETIITQIAEDLDNASSIRVWPEHFDTGGIENIAWNDQKEVTKSLGFGWAIPDSMIKEPYFYLNIWSHENLEGFNELPSPDAGEWSKTGWHGGVLTHSEIMKAGTSYDQQAMVLSFFRSGIKIFKEAYS
ncbi:MAG: hypothetical protein HN686_10435 [Bacteroidetes bacterium]|nr:hypothetical protein [Bacteroidota bacterium]